jgi:hypothetical protein
MTQKRKRLNSKEIEALEKLPVPSQRVGYSHGIIKQPNFKKVGGGNAVAQGDALSQIVGSVGDKDVKFQPNMASYASAYETLGSRRYSKNHRKYADKVIYKITEEDRDGDGIHEVVVRKAELPGTPIYMINGYELVKSRQAHRQGYEELFPNKLARAAAKAKGLTRKNYEQTALKFNPNTGAFESFKDFIPANRVEKLSRRMKEKMKARRLTLGDAFLFFLFEPAWRCFSAAAKTMFDQATCKLAIPKLLQLYVQAKRFTLRDIIIRYGHFEKEDIEYFNQFEDTNQFLHGRGKLIDDIWLKFVHELFDGDEKEEWNLYIYSLLALFMPLLRYP